MNLNGFVLIDTSTGTVLTPHTCVLVHESDLSSSEWEEMDSWSDAETCSIGRERGRLLSELLD